MFHVNPKMKQCRCPACKNKELHFIPVTDNASYWCEKCHTPYAVDMQRHDEKGVLIGQKKTTLKKG